MLTLRLKKEDRVIAERSHEEETYLAFQGREYSVGEVIELELEQANQLVWVQVDEALEPSLIYVTEKNWEYPIIVEEQLRLAYPSKIFIGGEHYLRAWLPTAEETQRYRNLARNTHDQKDDTNAYPHAHANVETRNDSTFFARNAIDGILANEDHGPYPYQSWGINQRKDAEITIDFGREVRLDKLALVLRGDYPHDSYWTQVTVVFSNGEERILETTNQLDRQYFAIPETKTTSITLKDLIKNEDESPFPALTQVEAYGREVN
ncbi:hypothetical protein ACFQOY_06345 [Enterococcus alcedinis]|uniref:Carbohydrate-binding protein n=1 Tax=Enterococcus alcedinis TaxID=1274384 RepID=A0A917N424_9ENTE|nr:hypothetical protein [Enterococcus alcedinis]MBP2101706.1 hypothetical protein [Enterococcus alcedinis]GGI65270.1 hypothetical protein GCM10011482_09240 [Enterococcus alcedinis]